MFVAASPLFLFLAALMFGLGIASDWYGYIIFSLVYILSILLVATQIILMAYKNTRFLSIGFIILLVLCSHLGILLGFIFASGSEDMLWPADAIDHHLPNALAISKWILGEGELQIFTENPFSKIYISNIWVGVFFASFGVHPVVSAVSMLVIKLISVYLIYRTAIALFYDKFIALSAAIVYGLMPTITFYTIQFYKDFFIQFLVALIIYIMAKSLRRPFLAFFIVIPLSILFIERFYLVVIICAALVIYYWAGPMRISRKILLLSLAGLASFQVLDYYFSMRSLYELVETIKAFEVAQNESTDVTPTTNVVLDLFRITFTPFFNFYKLEQYTKYDSLLTFGGALHQVVMLFYIRGLWASRKNKIVFLNFAFLFLLIILALVMPYDGRARDSFYALVSIFAAVGIQAFLRRKVNNTDTY